ncbi:hypothetical protein PAXINDRAFT_172516 [Paxillus involutus ATCC 200175]|uniref:Uncharacterized protein n=1 Tax=Paxillus involutus ATCC 200175 TaxID=664439 RepID=A0A0C9TQA2_PAXIN|nr:hypothetical protein PAXINDRAFT_172516 [Paxillus involutus ATCC 200175]
MWATSQWPPSYLMRQTMQRVVPSGPASRLALFIKLFHICKSRMTNSGEVERERLEKEVKVLLSSSYKSRVSQNPHTHTEAGPSSFEPSNSDSINLKLEERVKEEKRSASLETKTARRKRRRN